MSTSIPEFWGAGKERVTSSHLLAHTGGLLPHRVHFGRAHDITAFRRGFHNVVMVGTADVIRERRPDAIPGYWALGRRDRVRRGGDP